MPVLRREQSSDYTCIPNGTVCQSRKINCRERGLLVFLLSLPLDWHFTMEWVIDNCSSDGDDKEGRDAIMKARKGLEDKGYITVVCERSQYTNRFQKGDWVVRDTPLVKPEADGECGFPVTGKPLTENPQLQSNNVQRNISSLAAAPMPLNATVEKIMAARHKKALQKAQARLRAERPAEFKHFCALWPYTGSTEDLYAAWQVSTSASPEKIESLHKAAEKHIKDRGSRYCGYPLQFIESWTIKSEQAAAKPKPAPVANYLRIGVWVKDLRKLGATEFELFNMDREWDEKWILLLRANGGNFQQLLEAYRSDPARILRTT